MNLIHLRTRGIMYSADVHADHPQPMRALLEVAVTRAYTSGTDLAGADLRGAQLAGADLSGVLLHLARLNGTDLRAAYLRETDMTAVPRYRVVVLPGFDWVEGRDA